MTRAILAAVARADATACAALDALPLVALLATATALRAALDRIGGRPAKAGFAGKRQVVRRRE